MVSRVTGVGGKAQLGIVTLPDGQPLGPGSYTVEAFFGPNADLGFAVPDDPIFDPSSATLDGQFTVSTSATSSSPARAPGTATSTSSTPPAETPCS